MKIAISHAMNGKREDEIEEERRKIVEKARERGDIAIDTMISPFKAEGNAPLKFLAKSLEKIAEADAVIFLKGYEEARGCKIEYLACKEYGIRTMSEEEYCSLEQ
jgi:hypothetical protein